MQKLSLLNASWIMKQKQFSTSQRNGFKIWWWMKQTVNWSWVWVSHDATEVQAVLTTCFCFPAEFNIIIHLLLIDFFFFFFSPPSWNSWESPLCFVKREWFIANARQDFTITQTLSRDKLCASVFFDFFCEFIKSNQIQHNILIRLKEGIHSIIIN